MVPAGLVPVEPGLVTKRRPFESFLLSSSPPDCRRRRQSGGEDEREPFFAGFRVVPKPDSTGTGPAGQRLDGNAQL
jgi:hypothetical protein